MTHFISRNTLVRKIPYVDLEESNNNCNLILCERKIEDLRIERMLLENRFSILDIKSKNIHEMGDNELSQLLEENNKIIKDIKVLSCQVELAYGIYQSILDRMLLDSD